MEAELGEFDSFDSVLHGKERRAFCSHSFGSLIKLKAAVLSCAQRITTLSKTSLRSGR